MLSALCLWTIFTAQTQLASPSMDPRIDWQTISTPHFEIHFDPKTENEAQKIAGISESVWTKVTQKFNWEPSAPVHLVLSDSTDEPNGMAVPIPYNHIYLYATPPNDSSALDYYDDWITTLLTHEFTHTTHIDMARGLNKIPRAVLGRFWLPNAAQQQWAIEGLAEYNETYETSKGRGRSPFIEMYLRTVSLENEFASIDKATYWYHRYPYGNTAYWYGIGFHQYLRDKFGDQKIFDFANENASHLIPSFFNFKTKEIFGKSFSRLWAEWQQAEKIKFEKLRNQYQSQVHPVELTTDLKLVGRPVWSSDGKSLYTSLADGEDVKIYAWTQSDSGAWTSSLIHSSKGPNRMSFIEDHLIYSELGSTSPYDSNYDLYAFNLKTKKTKRLTRGLRVRDAFAFRDAIFAVRADGFKNSLIRIPLELDEKSEIPTDEVYPARHDLLFQAPGQSSIAKPKASSDGHYLAFTMRLEGHDRDLYLYDLRTGKVESLMNDIADDSDPEFAADNRSIYFSSYRKLATTDEPVLNIFQIDLESLQISQITDSWTGMSVPAVCQNRMALAHYHSYGWSLNILEGIKPLFADVGHGERREYISTESAPSWKFEKKPYRIGNTLLPRFAVPFVFYTESDTLIALLTGSRDPLSFHTWTGLAYYLSTPQRPGGALSYMYNGLPFVSFFAGGAAGITNYGQVQYTQPPSTSSYTRVLSDYYERNYRGVLGATHDLWWNGEATDFSFSHSLFFDRREPLLKRPQYLATGFANVNFSAYGKGTISNVQLAPDTGNQWGVSETLLWSHGVKQDIEGISPKEGSIVALTGEYSPKAMGSKFKQLTTLVSGKTYFEFARSHFLAARAATGLQWFDPIYQRTFSLGGTLGEGPLSSSGRRSYNMRGLPSSTLEGEGVISASIEYRLMIFDQLPGFGTAPIWIKNLHIATFADGGQTFLWKMKRTLSDILSNNDEKFGLNRFSFTSGAELRSDTSMSYLPPLTVRLGYGYLMALRGQWWLNRNQSQVYFELGTSF